MACDSCGAEEATNKVEFKQNIGVILARFQKTAEGSYCRSCIHRTFWSFTLTTLFLGWWSATSLVVAPLCILINIINYVMALVALRRQSAQESEDARWTRRFGQ